MLHIIFSYFDRHCDGGDAELHERVLLWGELALSLRFYRGCH